MKLDRLMKDLMKGHYLGRPIGYMQVIEFQKRGLPHAHILLILAAEDKPRNPELLDRLICAELPDRERFPDLYRTVTTSMLHGPCGDDNPNCVCMRDGACSKHYPKDFLDESRETEGFAEYRRRDDGTFMMKSVPGRRDPVQMTNRHVVPYNRILCMKYDVSTNF